MKSFIALLGIAALLAGCASAPPATNAQADRTWNEGVWNSVLGYHGPANSVVTGGP